MSFSDIGNLMCLPFDEIEPGDPTEAPEYLVQSSAKLLGPEGRNWIPLVVKEVEQDQYQVIGNSFIYAVVAEAGIQDVWCIIADDSEETQATTGALARERVPKTNLSTASREEISAALDYLINQPSSPLKGVSLATATTRIDEAPRKYWDSLQPISKLGCKITAGKKLKALERLFYLTPEPLPEVIRDRDLLESFNTKQLKDLAKKRKMKGYSKMTKSKLIDVLAAA